MFGSCSICDKYPSNQFQKLQISEHAQFTEVSFVITTCLRTNTLLLLLRLCKQMARVDSDLASLSEALSSAQIFKQNQPIDPSRDAAASAGVQVTCFSDVVNGTTALHFQIIRLQKQIYVWIGCNSKKLGHLYAAAPTRPSAVSVTSVHGGTSDDAGSGIARRLVSRTGLNIILACNIPKNSPMIELDAEKLLVQKLLNLGYIKPKSQVL